MRWESDYNTSAIGSLNADGSLDHGLFQISDLFWCDPGEACGLPCEGEIDEIISEQHFQLQNFVFLIAALRDDDIKDDVICAKRIFKQTQRLTGNGFNAW